MALSELYSSTASISSTPYSIPNGSTAPASITTDATIVVVWDASAMQKGDAFKLTIKEKATSGATQRTVLTLRLEGAQSELAWTPPLPVLHGWDVLCEKVTGTDRAHNISVRGYT